MREIVVLGAGVVGLTTALALAEDGHQVTVVDAAEGPGAGASSGNGAQLSYLFTDAFSSPALLRKIPSYLTRRDPAVRIRPTASWQFARWSCSFLANGSKRRFERNTLRLLDLALESRQRFRSISSRLGFDHRMSGKLTLYASQAGLRDAEQTISMKRSAGVRQSLLSPREALEIEPALASYAHPIAGALWSPEDEAGDCSLFCRGLRNILEEDYGVSFRFGTRITDIDSDRGRLASIRTDRGEIACRRAVIALGVDSRRIAARAGIALPIWPLQGYSMTIPALPDAPHVSITDSTRKIVFCRLADRLRIAGVADLGPLDQRFDAQRFSSFAQAAERAFPAAGDYRAEVNAWTGFRPMTPDNQPIIGVTRLKGLYVNCGHGSLGWTLSMGSAARLASQIREIDTA
ncbi:D-amino-acid dehydrogenase [Rhizobium sp. NFR07]|uniref:D-amino acid dehydrogenase n=1 Tax=Rhizobium sp. NFR07 TaxID=1566262 RepID=UPI0008F37E8C|nr:D-amino acid dehydrogenase [Rhizobium sp. NFR07]SFB63018.1 D-amino-acid dehydrogenase [Rhizobium sp. NFR07]